MSIMYTKTIFVAPIKQSLKTETKSMTILWFCGNPRLQLISLTELHYVYFVRVSKNIQATMMCNMEHSHIHLRVE